MYAKLFTSIYQGTLRGNSHGLLVFTNLLAHADQSGHVDVHPRAVAEEVGLTVEQVRAALDELEAPDIESRSPEEEGRRIVRLDEHRAWGWRVVNYAKYRAIRSEEDRREQNRLAQDKWRKKNKQSKPRSATVSRESAQSAQAEAEVEVEGFISKASPSHPAAKAKRGSAGPDGFDLFWKAYPRKVGKDAAAKAYAKRSPSTDVLDSMLTAIDQQKAGADWLRDGGQFIPHPATWLNEGRWQDEPRHVATRPPVVVAEPAWRREQRERTAQFLGPLGRKPLETVDVDAKRLD